MVRSARTVALGGFAQLGDVDRQLGLRPPGVCRRRRPIGPPRRQQPNQPQGDRQHLSGRETDGIEQLLPCLHRTSSPWSLRAESPRGMSPATHFLCDFGRPGVAADPVKAMLARVCADVEIRLDSPGRRGRFRPEEGACVLSAQGGGQSMKSNHKSPIWPYLAVLACLFAVCVLAPRGWQQLARTESIDAHLDAHAPHISDRTRRWQTPPARCWPPARPLPSQSRPPWPANESAAPRQATSRPGSTRGGTLFSHDGGPIPPPSRWPKRTVPRAARA